MAETGKGKIISIDEGQQRQSGPICLLEDSEDSSIKLIVDGWPDPESHPGDPLDLIDTCWDYETTGETMDNPWAPPTELPTATCSQEVPCEG